ncbi:Gfo/Idh/MocA family protein [Pseudoclavibacter sp. VKM Ac-2888]|uniref:Gfo/Idh/MocA family protein n=1 Tax=Pseudoclavibacter sp. VKM Ac-2888 TaxID=2783830 RepID=UPI00188B4EF0|nr:Gfo/Idh/MocA family oxidoreductase [Pseudoclavibacter sp. VKM Ac-2888]MBF4550814.1 Gfo/Idh/MocA family oxidoreductase [Pseudoclavibacter sp. VKM Ac-2888]
MTGPTTPAFVAELPAPIARLAEGVELLDPADAPPLRWGILGAGHIARRFAHEVPRHTRSAIAAVGARELSRAEAFAQELGVERAYGSYGELIADPSVDAIYLATINSTHHELALACIRAGKPVLVEKPFTLNAREAREVFAAAEQRGVLVVDGMWTRFLPQFTVTRQIAANGTLGRLVTAHANFAGIMEAPVPRIVDVEQGGGALLDIGVYSVAAVHDLMGSPIEVAAAGNLLPGYAVDGSASVIMRTASAVGTARCSFEGRAASSAEFVFERGIVELPGEFFVPGMLRVSEFDRDGSEEATDESTDGVGGATVSEWDATVPGGFQFEAAEFARLLAGGATQSPVMPWQASIEILEVLDQARAAVGVVYPGETTP